MRRIQSELVLLRREHQHLSQRLARFRMLRILALLLLVLALYAGFARGLKRAHTEELRQTRAQMARLEVVLGKGAWIISQNEDPLGYLEGDYEKGVPRASQKNCAPECPCASEGQDKNKITAALQANRKHMNDLYDQAFSLPVGLAFTEVNFDVRDWPEILPVMLFLFVLSSLYVHILSKKRELLGQVGAHLIETNPEEPHILDRLRWGRGQNPRGVPFVDQPSKFGNWLQRIVLLCFLSALIPLFAAAQSDEVPSLTGVLGIAACYLVVYGRYISSNLEAQTEAVLGRTPEPTWVARAWQKGRLWARNNFFRRKPKFCLLIGSLLVLATLYLATGVGSCGGGEPGYTIVRGQSQWQSESLVEPHWLSQVLSHIGRGAYIVSLGLAVLTLLLLLLSYRRPDYSRKPSPLKWLFILAGTLSLFVLGDFACLALLPIAISGAPWILGWLAPLALWYRFGFARTGRSRARWLKLRPLIVALYLPLLVADLVLLAMAASLGFYGLLAYFVGVHLLSIGYLQLTTGHGPPGDPAMVDSGGP